MLEDTLNRTQIEVLVFSDIEGVRKKKEAIIDFSRQAVY